MPSLYVRGMHGLGDNIHQRAVIRALIARGNDITLETSWPCIYQDLPVKFARRPVALRTQLKNAEREKDKFEPLRSAHSVGNSIRISYNTATINATASKTILEAMFASAGIVGDYAAADYTLPGKDGYDEITARLPRTDKPIMFYRPLVVRPEYRGAQLRNANPNNYAELVAMIRDSFYVISVADLEANREWVVGPQLVPDLTLHNGELDFDGLAAVADMATLMFTSSGFGAVLGPAVGTPTISIQGGYEPARWHADGAKFAPYLGINPVDPCTCASSACSKQCSKVIDLPRAKAAVAEFMTKIGVSTAAESRPLGEMFSPAAPAPVVNAKAPARPWPPVRAPRPGHPSYLIQRRPPVRA